MENPDYMSASEITALLAQSKAVSVDELEEMRFNSGRPTVEVSPLPRSVDDPDLHQFQISSLRGRFGDREPWPSYLGTIGFKVVDDGHGDTVRVFLDLNSPLR